MKKIFYLILSIVGGALIIIGALSTIFFWTLYTANKKIESISCEAIDTIWSRNLCYGDKAVREKNPIYCEKINVVDQDVSSRQNKGLCYVNVARRLKNPQICDLAKELRDWCRDYLAKNP